MGEKLFQVPVNDIVPLVGDASTYVRWRCELGSLVHIVVLTVVQDDDRQVFIQDLLKFHRRIDSSLRITSVFRNFPQLVNLGVAVGDVILTALILWTANVVAVEGVDIGGIGSNRVVGILIQVVNAVLGNTVGNIGEVLGRIVVLECHLDTDLSKLLLDNSLIRFTLSSGRCAEEQFQFRAIFY